MAIVPYACVARLVGSSATCTRLSVRSRTFSRGQGNAGGWPSSTGNASGGGRSNNPPKGSKEINKIKQTTETLTQQINKLEKITQAAARDKMIRKIKNTTNTLRQQTNNLK
mmetsp:Transcript_13807/g.27949  ORF Transcript_13807/g.27949 Transcript_13807/m.27949 type:complete len:111 (+) Transcript_13807:882-1214(+)